MRDKFIEILLLLILLFPFRAFAQDEKDNEDPGGWTPFQLSLWTPIQLFDEYQDVYGLRINLLKGKNNGINGLDLGFANFANDVIGIQIGVGGNEARSSLKGFQCGAINFVSGNGDVTGAQIGIANTAGYVEGFQLGIANHAIEVKGFQLSSIAGNHAIEVKGVQVSGGLFGNYATEVKGVQIGGLFNYAKRVKGVQIGLINYCERMTGIQIGVINIITEGTLPFFLGINISASL